MRDKMMKELRVLMTVLPLAERETLDATQACNIDPSQENVVKLLETASRFRAYREVLAFISRMLEDE